MQCVGPLSRHLTVDDNYTARIGTADTHATLISNSNAVLFGVISSNLASIATRTLRCSSCCAADPQRARDLPRALADALLVRARRRHALDANRGHANGGSSDNASAANASSAFASRSGIAASSASWLIAHEHPASSVRAQRTTTPRYRCPAQLHVG